MELKKQVRQGPVSRGRVGKGRKVSENVEVTKLESRNF